MIAREDRKLRPGVQYIANGIQQREIARSLVHRVAAQHDVRRASEGGQTDPPAATIDHPGGDERAQETLGVRMGVRNEDHGAFRPLPAAAAPDARQAVHHGEGRGVFPRLHYARQIRHAGISVEDRGQQGVRRAVVSKIVHAGSPMSLTVSILRLGLRFPDFPRTCQVLPCIIRFMTDQ